MMHGSLLRLLGVGYALVLTGACATGDDSDGGFSISGANLTQVTNPTSVSMGSTSAPTTGEPGDTGGSATTDGDDASTTNPATTATTTGVDPSTTTNVDPSTTTNVDPSTTTTDGTTGVMTTMTTMTTVDQTTGDPPPMKDPQPLTGLYEACLDPNTCALPIVNTCYTIGVDPTKPTDGFCTKACAAVADCGTKPMCPAVQECLLVNDTDKVCALKCANGIDDCPTGMVCINLSLPNNQSGFYCF